MRRRSIMYNCIKNGLKNIFRKKLRSLLTISGVMIGVISVIIISSIGDIGKHTINQELDSLGMNGLSIGTDKSVTGKDLAVKELELLKAQSLVYDATPLIAVSILKQFSSAIVTKPNKSSASSRTFKCVKSWTVSPSFGKERCVFRVVKHLNPTPPHSTTAKDGSVCVNVPFKL